MIEFTDSMIKGYKYLDKCLKRKCSKCKDQHCKSSYSYYDYFGAKYNVTCLSSKQREKLEKIIRNMV